MFLKGTEREGKSGQRQLLKWQPAVVGHRAERCGRSLTRSGFTVLIALTCCSGGLNTELMLLALKITRKHTKDVGFVSALLFGMTWLYRSNSPLCRSTGYVA